MFIECFKNNGKEYLRVTEVFRDEHGTAPKCRRRVIKNIGPLSRFDDGKPDYLARLRQSFRDGAPIIESLSELYGAKTVHKKVRIECDPEKEEDYTCDPKNIGYFVLDGLYDALGIYDVLNSHKSKTKTSYDLNGAAKLLVFGRLLWPDSKLGTFEGRDSYLFPVAKAVAEREIYRALDVLDAKAETIQKRMNTKIRSTVGRNTEVCFYDVTNFWFEIGQNDKDEIDADGNVTQRGLRKKGVSKEKRGEPIVQMGLFIDDNGIPIAYRLFPGNNTDQTTLRPALEKSIDKMKFGKVVIVADGGLNTGPNIAHILSEGNGYIVSKSTKKSDKEVRAWILDGRGYKWNKDRTFKVKSKIRVRKIKDADGNTVTIKEKLICYWSRKHYDREVRENAKFIEYLDSVIANPDKLKDKPKKIEQFLAKTEVVKETGEIVDTKTLLSIDTEKVKEYMDLLGYYTLMTSEVKKTDREIISKYHGLSRIEDSFRITKSDLDGRPVFVRTPGHINAHFLVCFIALTMIRLIQYRVLKHQGKNTLNDDGWESGVTAERIKEALCSFQADALPGGYYRLTKPNDDMRLIFESMGVDADLRLPIAAEIRQLKKAIDDVDMGRFYVSTRKYH
jgi:transposase